MEYKHINPLRRSQQFTSKGFVDLDEQIDIVPKLEATDDQGETSSDAAGTARDQERVEKD